ncbi:putative membrane protein [Evansella vedderi]|uniref:Membrane protein n=1 Tax=Evansella vedderi TaxID=38282 RepID=A0ABT9ZZL3_9BACI|nr:hypothetical protein [Evansella vedderi]MDQ0256683.1 putative membrane protein [Evansella vedderi]
MGVIRSISLLIVSFIFTILILVGSYLLLSAMWGTVVSLIGLAILFSFIIYSIIGLIRGRMKLFRLKTRFSIFLIFTYFTGTTILLFIVWLINYTLYDITGENLTAEELLKFILFTYNV